MYDSNISLFDTLIHCSLTCTLPLSVPYALYPVYTLSTNITQWSPLCYHIVSTFLYIFFHDASFFLWSQALFTHHPLISINITNNPLIPTLLFTYITYPTLFPFVLDVVYIININFICCLYVFIQFIVFAHLVYPFFMLYNSSSCLLQLNSSQFHYFYISNAVFMIKCHLIYKILP